MRRGRPTRDAPSLTALAWPVAPTCTAFVCALRLELRSPRRTQYGTCLCYVLFDRDGIILNLGP